MDGGARSTPRVAIVTPYRPGDPWRERNWRHVSGHYARHHPWPHIAADTPGEWSKGAALNAAVAGTDADILVMADADSFTSPGAVEAAVQAVADGAPWAVPHNVVYRLTDEESLRVIAGATPDPRNLVRPQYAGPAGGGIFAITRSAWDTVGGIDTRFTGWGGEDIALRCALDTLAGPAARIGADLFHLWHPHPAPDLLGSPEVEALKQAYLDAHRSPRQMRALVAHEPPPGADPLPAPRRFRTPRPSRVVRVGNKPARFTNHLLVTRDPDIAEAMALFDNVEEVTEGRAGIEPASPALQAGA